MISPSDLPDIGQTTVLLALPWKSIETPQQARALNLIGFLCCTALGILSVVFAVHVSIFKPDPDLLKGFLGSAVVFCGCAVGLRFSSRVAAIIGFVGIVFISLFALLLKTSLPSNPDAPGIGPMIGCLLIFADFAMLAGVKGTFATARLVTLSKSG